MDEQDRNEITPRDVDALERRLARTAPEMPPASLRASVLAEVRAVAVRATWGRRIAVAAASLAAAALLLTRPAGIESTRTPAPDLAGLDRPIAIGSFELDTAEQRRLALLTVGRASLPEVAPVPMRPPSSRDLSR